MSQATAKLNPPTTGLQIWQKQHLKLLKSSKIDEQLQRIRVITVHHSVWNWHVKIDGKAIWYYVIRWYRIPAVINESNLQQII